MATLIHTQNKIILFSIMILINLHGTNIDCENATNNNDLIRCAKEQMELSNSNFHKTLNKLMSSEVIKLNDKKKLKNHYINAKHLLITICKNNTTAGRLMSMYINYCIADQLDILSKSQKNLICIQQDADGCTDDMQN